MNWKCLWVQVQTSVVKMRFEELVSQLTLVYTVSRENQRWRDGCPCLKHCMFLFSSVQASLYSPEFLQILYCSELVFLFQMLICPSFILQTVLAYCKVIGFVPSARGQRRSSDQPRVWKPRLLLLLLLLLMAGECKLYRGTTWTLYSSLSGLCWELPHCMELLGSWVQIFLVPRVVWHEVAWFFFLHFVGMKGQRAAADPHKR